MLSTSLSPGALAATLIIATTIFAARLYRRSRSTLKFPPGPPTLPFLGNMHQMPLRKAFLQFTKWSKQYGPVFGLHIGSQKVVVLNSWRAVRELFDKRGAVYSSRPDIPIVQYVVPQDAHLAFMKSDKRWRRARTLVVNFLKDEGLERLAPIQDAESTQMLWEVLQEPQNYRSHVMRQFCAVILASVFGQRGQSETTGHFFRIQGEFSELLDSNAFPPLDVMPWLKYVPAVLTPWPGWEKRATDLKNTQRIFYKNLFESAKAKVERGDKKDIFMCNLLEKQGKGGFNDTELSYLAGFLIEAGSDTTANASLVFLLAMAAYPEVQKIAQAEIDSIFPPGKMPQSNDLGSKNLPYLQATFWEVLRWRPGLPTSIPHATVQDDVYKNFLIPANTTVLMNTWAIHHDPEEYHNPDVFDPSRFLESEFGNASESEDNALRKKTYAFGAARRICAGSDLAEKSLLLTMAKVLWAFDMRPTGNSVLETNLEASFTNGILTGPKNVGIDFNLRDESKREVVAREWERADAFLKTFE